MPRKIIPEKVEKAKSCIIQAAVELIIKEGFSKFTLTAVAQKVGITKAALYWYFSSKEALIAALTNSIKDEFIGTAKKTVSMPLTPKEKLTRVLNGAENAVDEFLCIFPIKIFLEYYSKEIAIKSVIRQSYIEYINIISSILKEGIVAEEFNSFLRIDETAKYIVGGMDGTAIQAAILGEDYKTRLKNFIAATMKLVLVKTKR